MRKEVVGVTVCEVGGWHALCPRWMWRFWGPAGTERSFEQHDYVRRTLCDVYASWWRGTFCFSVALRWDARTWGYQVSSSTGGLLRMTEGGGIPV